MTMQTYPWHALGDIALGRPNLGSKTEVVVYRMMQYTMRALLTKRFGDEVSRELFRDAGKMAGMSYCKEFLDVTLPPNSFIAQLKQLMIQHGIGIMQVEKSDLEAMNLTITVSEDLDCSGLPVEGTTVCDYDEGFIAGILEVYVGKVFRVREIDCWATGERTCRFDIRLEESVDSAVV